MDQSVSIRKAEFRDIEPIKAILFSALKEYEIAIPDNYAVSDIDSIDKGKKRVTVFALVRNDAVIGFVVLKQMSESTIELKRLYLTAVERGRRLGEVLLNFAIAFANKHHYRDMKLETTSIFKEAVSLYKKHGFRELKDVEKAPGHDLAFEKRLASKPLS